MLDMFLNFITFIIISIKGFLSVFIFRPPKPAGKTKLIYTIDLAYRTQMYKTEENLKEKVLIQKRGKNKVYEPVEFSTLRHEYIKIPDGEESYIPAILLKPVNCFKLCIIYSHGNSCDIGISFFECCDISLNTNCCVLLYEYPGYGLCSNRRLSEEGVYYNIRQAYSYLKSELNFTSEEIILYGHSLGTGPSVDLATDKNYPVAALVLQAPFLSILRTVADFDKTPFFDSFANIDKVHELTTPTLIIHGTKDTIVPPEDGELLSRRIPEEHLYEFFRIVDGDHNDIIKNHKAKVYKKLRQFLNHATKNNFSFESTSRQEGRQPNDMEIRTDFFQKLKPQEGDQEINPIMIEEETYRNIVIKHLIENDLDNVGIELACIEPDQGNCENEKIKNEDIKIEIKEIKMEEKNIC